MSKRLHLDPGVSKMLISHSVANRYLKVNAQMRWLEGCHARLDKETVKTGSSVRHYKDIPTLRKPTLMITLEKYQGDSKEVLF